MIDPLVVVVLGTLVFGFLLKGIESYLSEKKTTPKTDELLGERPWWKR